MIRRIVLSVAPYPGMLTVTAESTDDSFNEGSPLRLTLDRTVVQSVLPPKFRSLEDPGADEMLLDLLVRFYRTWLDFDGDLCITLHETRNRNPITASFDDHNIYLEFGAIRAIGSASI
jgi:hypothetical protein